MALLVVLSLVAAACGGGNDTDQEAKSDDTEEATETKIEERAPGGTLVYGADQEPTGFNGNTSKDNGTSVKNVIENLFYYAVKATPDFGLDYIGLDEEPKVISESPQVIEWNIHKDAVWSDGTPVTTADIKYFWETMEAKDPSKVTEENPKGYIHDVASHVGYEQITKLDVVDDKTFRATFDPTYSDFRGLWFDIPQAKFMQSQPGGWDTGLDNNPGPSAGPYVFKEYKKGESLTLERNPKWWGKVKPTLDTLVFRFLPESTTQPDALRNNEVDFIYPQPQLDLVDQVKALTDVKSEIGFGPIFEHLTFNFQNEFLKDLAVRKAIAHGVDRNAIVEALMKPFSDKASRLDNRVLMSNQEGYKANGKEYQNADPAKAEKALTDGGYTKGPDGFYAKNGKKVSVRLSTTAGNQLREQQGELIKAQLAKVGIDIRIDNSPSKVLFGTRLPAGDFDIANFAWVGSVFPLSGAKQIYETGTDSNYGKYSNPEFDKVAKEAAAELDEKKQLELADQEDVIMWKDLPNLPLYQKPTFLGVRNKFVNVKDNTTNEGPFWNSQTFGLRKATQ
ncbi:MAG: ABC transporter family substrate-binding protein [Actinobacteria bacterium]|nr:ABC transporter family substrate-binding protein [Actinomycetota bacterium]